MSMLTSLHNPTLKLIRSLADKKHRKEHGLFVAEGPAMLARAKAEGWEPVYVLGTRPPEPWGKAQCLTVDEKVMAALSGQNNPHGTLAVFRQRLVPKVAPQGVWLALEDIRDPGNLGTILRTADAAGAAGIIIAGQSCDPFAPDCVRATTGSIFGVPLAVMPTASLIALCREWPGDVVGTHLQAQDPYRRAYAANTLVVMGSEANGLSDALAGACSRLVRIPMPGRAESLNVAIATGLMLFEVIKR